MKLDYSSKIRYRQTFLHETAYFICAGLENRPVSVAGCKSIRFRSIFKFERPTLPARHFSRGVDALTCSFASPLYWFGNAFSRQTVFSQLLWKRETTQYVKETFNLDKNTSLAKQRHGKSSHGRRFFNITSSQRTTFIRFVGKPGKRTTTLAENRLWPPTN